MTNNLTIPQTKPAAVPSVFDDPNAFGGFLQMATALSKAAFVPKAFQNSPESCLIAIDLSRRLGISPLALLPHLYVIDNKPAFSSQFLITLVNRSGLFERLDWERGVDGDVQIHIGKWNDKAKHVDVVDGPTVPNVWAVAKLVERRTRREYKSPRVDVAFADRNGWTAKLGSKWLTMPEQMVAYRSAAMLIRSVCPEVTLGLFAAEDVADGADVVDDLPAQPSRPVETRIVEPEAVKPETGVDLAGVYVKRIKRVGDAGELETLGAEIARAGLTPEQRETVAAAYKARRAELSEEIADAAEQLVAKFMEEICDATDRERLADLAAQAESFAKAGQISGDDLNKIFHAIDVRAEEGGF